MVIDVAKIVGKGYREFWEAKERYVALKGGRGSKKSTTAALKIIYMMMYYYHTHGLKPSTLVVRRFYNTHGKSTFNQLLWAINQLGVRDRWHATRSPLQLLYKPSGQTIIFRGMDDPQSITSITVEEGHLCWCWWEEAYQISNEEDFNKVDLSIRGAVPAPLFKQHIFTMNPWSENTWLKKRFFDKVGMDGRNKKEDIFAITRNYDCNEFLDDADLLVFERMRINSPKRYAIEGLGQWGIAEGLIYTNVVEQDFDIQYILERRNSKGQKIYKPYHGVDFGYSNDPTAYIGVAVDQKDMKILIFDEFGRTGMTNQDIYDEFERRELLNTLITADTEPRTINELQILGVNRIRPAKKGQDSINAGIQKLQDYQIIVHPRCSETMIELVNYTWAVDKETGKFINKPVDEYNHWMDAFRYGTESISRGNFEW